jgi:clathrin heavy chain
MAQRSPRLHNGESSCLLSNRLLLTKEQPFLINTLAQQTATIELLKKDNEERKTREASQQKDEDSTPILGGSRLMLTQGPISSAPSPAPYGQANGIAPQATGFRAF